ncbi:HAD family hydrolase [Kiritimatiellaeota bacterium B1221]|nr:HAD family hydrolase [Kiritimatiellaeota bacterium B1221]
MAKLTTVLFDYGNTLIAFGPDQQLAQAAAMAEVLSQAGLTIDNEKLTKVRKDQILRPYRSGGKENVFEEVCREIVELAGPDPTGGITRALMAARQKAFIKSVGVQPDVPPLLERLKEQYRLGFLSNYPCSHSIISSLENLGMADFFESVVVSADVGYAKPHPDAYATLIKEMNLDPAEAVYVGDNWLADVQGAKRAGMRAIWVREHIPYETFEPEPGDIPPDAEIHSLMELESVLAAWTE